MTRSEAPPGRVVDPPKRILIVDDERDNRELLGIILGYEGFLVTSAVSGEEALAIVTQARPDLILLDGMMPGMDGYLVAARIKGNPDTAHIPIIMVTGLAGRQAELRALGAGADEHLTKPICRAELVARVKERLR